MEPRYLNSFTVTRCSHRDLYVSVVIISTWGWLEHHLHLFDVYLQSKSLCCTSKTSNDFLHVFMGVGNESSVISEHELANQDGLSSGSRLELVRIK